MSFKSGFWRKCRIAFRCVRFTVWGLMILLLCAIAWFNRIGLPDFLKTRLVAALHDRGVQLEFSRLRLSLGRGIVCDNVCLGTLQGTADPVFSAREVQLRIDYPALLRRRFQVDGLVLRHGKLSLSLAPGDTLTLTNLQGELRILPEDTWSLDELTGNFADATFKLGGVVAHAPECRHWAMFAPAKTADRGSVQASLRQFSSALKQVRFAPKTQVSARLSGDAQDVRSFSLRISGRAPGVQTPSFSASNLEFAVRVLVSTNAPAHPDPAWDFWTRLQPFQIRWLARASEVKGPGLILEGADAEGEWSAPDLALNSFSVRLAGGALEASAKLDVASRELTFGASSTFDLHVLAGMLPDPARDGLQKTSWAVPPRLRVVGSWIVPPWTNRAADWGEALGSSLRMQGDLALTNASVAGWMAVDFAHTHFHCADRTWTLPDLQLARGRTVLALSVQGNEATRDFHCRVSGNLGAGIVRPFLTTTDAICVWDRLRFGQPVGLALDVAGNLRNLSTLTATGQVAVTDLAISNAGAAGALTVDSARTHFNYTNHIWVLPDLELSSGRTMLNLNVEANAATWDFRFLVGGKVDPVIVRSFLTTSRASAGFGHLTFQDPAPVALNVAGNFRDFGALSVTGRVQLTNFAVRGQWIDSLTTTLSYSNLQAEFYEPELLRAGGAEKFDAEEVKLDLSGQRLFLRGGRGRVLPKAVAAAIGPQTAAAMEPYHFLALPEATVEGCIPLKFQDGDLVTDDADLQFNVQGTLPFRWRKFETPAMTGTIRWLGNDLILTNITASCYGGTARGWGVFDVQTPGEGTDFSFFMAGTNVDFNAMGRALWSPTNQLRGALSGQITVTSANSSDWRTWNGYGQAQLQNGMLWDAPAFGLMSSVLNEITPGLDIGNNRATDGSGSFAMTNGVIYTDSLEIRSLTMRFDYVGTVDLTENVAARVKAELLRNTPVVGSIFSTLLSPVSKVLECEVTGTLDQPKIKPVYFPFSQYVTSPLLHPIRTVEKIFTAPSTNSPPKP